MNREELIDKVHQDFKSGKIDFGQALEATKITDDERYQVGIDLGKDEGTHIYTMSEKDFLSYLCEVAKGNNPKLIRHTDNEEAHLTLKTINK